MPFLPGNQMDTVIKPAKTMTFRCIPCNQTFKINTSLKQHKKNSPAHNFNCVSCKRRFSSQKALQDHMKSSSVHVTPISQENTETPLDAFFKSFPTFDYDPSLPPATAYAKLQRHERWHRDSPASKEAWTGYQDALQAELQMWFGSESDLTAWHAICRAVGIDPLPTTCEGCEKAARKTHVNIVDLIEWGRRGDEEKKVETFRGVSELRNYTRRTRKIFPLTEGGDNVVLRHLLRKIFKR